MLTSVPENTLNVLDCSSTFASERAICRCIHGANSAITTRKTIIRVPTNLRHGTPHDIKIIDTSKTCGNIITT